MSELSEQERLEQEKIEQTILEQQPTVPQTKEAFYPDFMSPIYSRLGIDPGNPDQPLSPIQIKSLERSKGFFEYLRQQAEKAPLPNDPDSTDPVRVQYDINRADEAIAAAAGNPVSMTINAFQAETFKRHYQSSALYSMGMTYIIMLQYDINEYDATKSEPMELSELFWMMAHFVPMCCLGTYSVLNEYKSIGKDAFDALIHTNKLSHSSSSTPLFGYFMAVQLCLYTIRVTFFEDTIPSTPINNGIVGDINLDLNANDTHLQSTISFLPTPIKNIVSGFILHYKFILSSMIHDMLILLAIVGIYLAVLGVF